MSYGKLRGRSGGMSKHRKSGKTTKSPKMRHHLMLEAAKNVIKSAPPLNYSKVSELFR